MNTPIEAIKGTPQQKNAAFEWLKTTDFGSAEANLHALIMAQELVDLNTKRATNLLNPGETYAGAIITPTGVGHHIILLLGDNDDATWNDAMEWAKSIGGDLPDRVEQALFYKHLRDQFQKDWYWSNTQHAVYSDYAWCQYVNDGYQYDDYRSGKCRARAVRRVAI